MKCEKSVSLIATYTYIIASYCMTKQGNGSSPFPAKLKFCSHFSQASARLTALSLAVRQGERKVFLSLCAQVFLGLCLSIPYPRCAPVSLTNGSIERATPPC